MIGNKQAPGITDGQNDTGVDTRPPVSNSRSSAKTPWITVGILCCVLAGAAIAIILGNQPKTDKLQVENAYASLAAPINAIRQQTDSFSAISHQAKIALDEVNRRPVLALSKADIGFQRDFDQAANDAKILLDGLASMDKSNAENKLESVKSNLMRMSQSLKQCEDSGLVTKRYDTSLEGELPQKLKGLVDKAKLAAVPPVQSTKVVYVYPTGVSSLEERRGWDSIRDIARDYFAMRSSLARAVPFDRIKAGYGSFSQYSYAIDRAISARQVMLNRLESYENVNGLSEYTQAVKTMINNSLTSLQYLKGDNYASFKQINNQNDRIQVQVRRLMRL